jgi:malate dehydrogenase (oxaloacetate-decarboxylating)(NADP+)
MGKWANEHVARQTWSPKDTERHTTLEEHGMSTTLRDKALRYHEFPKPGKLSIQATKPMDSQSDLTLAYSPGVAEACLEISADPGAAARYTTRANLIAVVSNGTAVLGLGDIGALASKPVMEGKAVLFKKFADIDVFDIEIDERDPHKLVEIIAGLEATFGGINLEDIKAPDCYVVEELLKQRMKIPVFHDDQHGTAIVTAVAILNGLRVLGKEPGDVRLVVSGAGAAAIACLDLVLGLGVRKENILVCDSRGVIHDQREDAMDPKKRFYAARTEARTLTDAIAGADVFLGLSRGGALSADMVATMADRPLILALANPTPEIMPEEARAAKPDAVIATGRSDYPNQVNNVLCFPFIFRGALDVGATTINEAMKLACVKAIADLTTAEVPEVVANAYGGERLVFGPEYILPKPFDPRLISVVPPAVAQAAMDTGVATRPITDMKAYVETLTQSVYKTGFVMRPLFLRARQQTRRVLYAEGEDNRVLRAALQVVDEGLARPILIGRAPVIAERIRDMGLRLQEDKHYDVVNPMQDSRVEQWSEALYQLTGRKGVSPEAAGNLVRSQSTALAAMMLQCGETDAMLCGAVGSFPDHVWYVEHIVGLEPGVCALSALSVLIMPQGTYFICDTHVTPEPDARELAEMAILAAREVRRFGIEPSVAMISHSSFGSHDTAGAARVREALALIRAREPDLEVDGEMRVDAALSKRARDKLCPDSRIRDQANLLIMPNLDSANTAFGLLRSLGNGVAVGPILIGAAKPAHVVSTSITTRGLVNMTAMAAVQSMATQKD